MAPSPLRRRGRLQALDGIDNLETEDNEDEMQLYHLYRSPCSLLVSNDPLQPIEDICDAVLFTCVESHPFSPTSKEVAEILIAYDYEMHYDMADMDFEFEALVEYLEGVMLLHLASLLGLADCDAENGDFRRYQRQLSDILDLNMEPFVAIGSDPKDHRDVEHEACVVPVESKNLIDTECQPMKGYFKVFVEEEKVDREDENNIIMAMLDTVRLGMEYDTYISGAIKKLSFVDRNPNGVSGGGPEMGGKKIGLLSLAGFLFLLILLAVCCIFGLRQRRKHLMAEEHPDSRPSKRLFSLKRVDSILGSDIPGSLAATDALALKPQAISYPSTPPRKIVETNQSTPSTHPNSPDEIDDQNSPLTPVRDQNSGIVPPSRVLLAEPRSDPMTFDRGEMELDSEASIPDSDYMDENAYR